MKDEPRPKEPDPEADETMMEIVTFRHRTPQDCLRSGSTGRIIILLIIIMTPKILD